MARSMSRKEATEKKKLGSHVKLLETELVRSNRDILLKIQDSRPNLIYYNNLY